MARPTLQATSVEDRIVEELLDGKSLRQICEAEDMPNRSTVVRWLAADEDFATRYAHARDAQADLMDDYILETANAAKSDTAAADRVKIDAYKWRASKLRPKVYGDKQQVEHSGGITLGSALDVLPD